METRANYAIVGFFTIVVVAAAFAFVYWFANYGRSGELAPMIVRIPGSANGLSVGSGVRFNGIPVGIVHKLYIDQENPNFAIAETGVKLSTPIYPNTKAILEIEGLTGGAYIELSGQASDGENLLARAYQTGVPVTIEAAPSSVTNILSTADQILQRVDKVVDQLEGFVDDSRSPLTKTLENAETFTTALAENASGIDTFLESVSALSDTVGGMSGRIDTVLGSVENLLVAVDAQKIDNILTRADTAVENASTAIAELNGFVGDARAPLTNTLKNAETFSDKLAENADGIDKFLESVSALSDTVSGLSGRLDTTLASAEKILTSVDPDKIASILSKADAAASDAGQAVSELNGLVADARTPLTETLQNAQTFSKSLADNSQNVDAFLASVGSLSETLTRVSGRLDSTLERADTLLAAVDPEKIDSIVTNVDRVSGDFADASGGLSETIASLREMSATFSTAATEAQSAISKVDSLLAGVDPAKVSTAVNDMAAATAGARQSMDDISKVTAKIGGRDTDIDQAITDVSEMASKLNAASSRVDGVLAKLDGFLGEGDASGIMADAQQTLESFKQVADNLNQRIGPISDNLQRFSGTGLRDIQALVTETRRSIARIENSISTLERDPQRLIFGGDSVKQYKGQNRR